MPRTSTVAVLSAVAIAAALGLGGCSEKADVGESSPVTQTPAPPTSSAQAAPAILPPPDALIDVMARITDPNVPGADKVGLVEMSTINDAAALDNLSTAISDSKMRPLTFEANNVRWAGPDGGVDEGRAAADFVIKTTDPARPPSNFPLEFTQADDGSWQLSRQTADELLQFDGENPLPQPPP